MLLIAPAELGGRKANSHRHSELWAVKVKKLGMFRPAHCFLDLLCSQKRERIKYSFLFFFLCTYYQSLQSCPTLCDPMDCSPPHSSVHGILQARILECVAISFSRGSSQPRMKFSSPALAGEFFTTSATWEANCWTSTDNKPKYKIAQN